MPGKLLGVVICNCSDSITELLDIPFLKEKARHCADECEVHPALCTKEGIEFLKNFITEKKLERVVIAACTPTRSTSKRGYRCGKTF